MRLLNTLSERNARSLASGSQRRAAPAPALELAPELTNEDLFESQAIGARFEEVSSSLDAASQLARQIQTLEQRIAEVRAPLQAEFDAHKKDYSELVAARAAAEQEAGRAGEAERREVALRARVIELEAALDDAQHAAATHLATSEDATLEVDRLRGELSSVTNRSNELDAALHQATQRNEELQQDLASARNQAQESDDRRREADALLSRATHQNLLDAEELSTLRTRAERASGEISRLTRLEQDLGSQLANERARTAAAESALLQAQTDAAKAAQTFEEQLAAARWESESVHARVDTLAAQAARLTELNGELSGRVESANARARTAERRIAEMQTQQSRSEERVRAVEEELASVRTAAAGLEAARATAIERAQQMSRNLQAQEAAVRRLEEKLQLVRATNERLETSEREARQAYEEKVKTLEADLERKQTDLSISEGALEAARKDRARLQIALLGQADEPALAS